MLSTSHDSAAHAFRRFFEELRGVYLEREALFTQIELALLCREHVLVIGPPGTAKSAVASAVLSRIVDEHSGAPSLFARQLSESTVQTDLIGPVDFKVLTETGRTEYLIDDGMLGHAHAFLDEVFDGRDMLLRSILNVLFERELKHGKRLTAGRLSCAIMTSNRYLSEVLARSPELLLAFADRLAFISFVPKSFARSTSRAAMLSRSAHAQRIELRCSLTLQQLARLHQLVEQVKVPSLMLEGLELVSDQLERALMQQVNKLPDYVPTKYFSQRTLVKALWALKASVVRDYIFGHSDRALEVERSDLEMLRYFFLLGGPPPSETDALLKIAADPRERAQLEIVRLEQRTFDEVMNEVRDQLDGSVERELLTLKPSEDLANAESIARDYQPNNVRAEAKALREKLVPGPRHPENRNPLLVAARSLLGAAEQRLARGMAGQGEGRGGVSLLSSVSEVLHLARAVPELNERLNSLCSQVVEFTLHALEMIGLSAESAEFEDVFRLEGLAGLAASVASELHQIRELAGVLATVSPEHVEPLRTREGQTRDRIVSALRRRAALVFEGVEIRGDAYESLAADSRRLEQLERALANLSPEQSGLREELLEPLGTTYARKVLAESGFHRIEQYGRVVQTVLDSLRRQGIPAGTVLAKSKDVIEARLIAYAQGLSRDTAQLTQPVNGVFNGEAYSYYRDRLNSSTSPDGELAALIGLEGQLSSFRNGASAFLSASVRDAVAQAELSFLQIRVNFIRAWLTHLLVSLPETQQLRTRNEAERAFDRLVRSRFPMLAMKEGELLRLQGTLSALSAQPGDVARAAQELTGVVQGISEDFGGFSKRLLEARASL